MEKKNDSYVVDIDYKKNKQFKYLLLSDVHFDSTKCDRKLLKKHLDEAKEINAPIFIFGDFFDCMGGKWDKRSTKADIRPEYQTQTYFQDIARDAAKFLAPYKELIYLLADGNHETSIKVRHEFDLLDDLSDRLGGINRGKYSGFIRFRFHKGDSNRFSKILYYTHGGGGNSPVTKGVIKTARRQESIMSDIYVSGHVHTDFNMERTMVYLSDQGVVKQKAQLHLQLGTYKNDFMTGGWADHKEFSAPNMGGKWLVFDLFHDNGTYNSHIDSARAK